MINQNITPEGNIWQHTNNLHSAPTGVCVLFVSLPLRLYLIIQFSLNSLIVTFAARFHITLLALKSSEDIIRIEVTTVETEEFAVEVVKYVEKGREL